jgi:hypothetical protein
LVLLFPPALFRSRGNAGLKGLLPATHAPVRLRYTWALPPLDLLSPSESPRLRPPLPTSGRSLRPSTTTSLEVPSPSAPFMPGSPLSRVCLARFVPPSAFLRSRRLTSPKHRRPCFMPTYAPGFRTLQSFPSPRSPARLVGAACLPSCRSRSLARRSFRFVRLTTAFFDSRAFFPSRVRHPKYLRR